MSDPAFAYQFKFGDGTAERCKGISQRRLLAGMILSGWIAGNCANQNSEPWSVHKAVKESLYYADELIKQTEET